MIDFTFTTIAKAHMDRRRLSSADMLGTIPEMISTADPAGAVEQIDRAYRDVGGGWRDSTGFVLSAAPVELKYPGDPARVLIARAQLREESILFFDGAWIAVVQPDGTARVARID